MSLLPSPWPFLRPLLLPTEPHDQPDPAPLLTPPVTSVRPWVPAVASADMCWRDHCCERGLRRVGLCTAHIAEMRAWDTDATSTDEVAA